MCFSGRMLLGAVGMGCALALTYRERQRKVRAALCTTCHTRYGATVDGKWREGMAPRPRGPSRAVYAYNGISHKFYASYGAMSEKPGGGLKHPAALHKPSAPSVKQAPPPARQEPTPVKASPEPEKDEEGGDAPSVDAKELQSPGNSSNPDPPSAPNTDSSTVSVTIESPATTSITSHTDSDKKVPPAAAPEEKLACNCLSRYGGMRQRPRERIHHRTPGDGGAPRRRTAQPEVRTVGKYNKRILMQCRARDPKDVPVHLFSATSVSANQDTVSTATTASPATTSADSCSGSRPLPPRGLSSATNLSLAEESNAPRDKETLPHSGCDPPEACKSHDSHSPAGTRAPSHRPTPRPPSPAPPSRPSPSPPLTPAAEGISSGDSAHEAFQSLQDPEVASMSSECGLLPSSEEPSAPHRSPLWAPWGNARRERRSEERQAGELLGGPRSQALDRHV